MGEATAAGRIVAGRDWRHAVRADPVPLLLDWPDETLRFFVRRDLLDEAVPPLETIWHCEEAARLVTKQQADGSWKYAGKSDSPQQNYSLLETYRNLRLLVEKYGFDRSHGTLRGAAGYIFSCQQAEGDIRGILGNQYMPYYHGAFLALLIKAGYVDDGRVERGLAWLLAMRQDDGGWIVPTQAVPSGQRSDDFWRGRAMPPDRSLPHAHLATGMVLRAFAAHLDYQRRPEIIAAAEALKSRFFQPDKYNDRKAKAYWFKFQFPYWWSNLLTAMDDLANLGFDRNDEDIARGLDWFVTNQAEDGLWPTGYGAGNKAEEGRRWVGLAICRVLKKLSSQQSS